jgi:site-specific recombinase XerD
MVGVGWFGLNRHAVTRGELEVFERWRVHMDAAGLARGTIAARRSTFRAWWTYCDGDPFHADHHTIEAWLANRSLAPATAQRHLSDLHRFYRWAQREGLTASDPTVFVEPRHRPRRVPRPAPTRVVKEALWTDDTRLRVAVALMAYGGLRCCEVAGLRVGDVDFDARRIFVRGKGSHERYVPLVRQLRAQLGAFDGAPPGTPVFESRKRPGPASPGRVSQVIGAHLSAIAGERIGAHQLRHWYAGEVLNRTGSLETVQQLLGHASIATTQGYAVLLNVSADVLEAFEG